MQGPPNIQLLITTLLFFNHPAKDSCATFLKIGTIMQDSFSVLAIYNIHKTFVRNFVKLYSHSARMPRVQVYSNEQKRPAYTKKNLYST